MSAAKCFSLFAFLLVFGVYAQEGQDFTDSQLASLLETQKAGVIYIWSPHMNYSVLGRRVIKQVCRDLGVHLTTLVDPNANEKGDKNQASELMKLGAGIHFPSLHLFSNGVLLPDNLMGAKSYTDYKSYIAKQLKLEVRNEKLDTGDFNRFLCDTESCRLEDRTLNHCAEGAELFFPCSAE
jgi:hypothetical protein